MFKQKKAKKIRWLILFFFILMITSPFLMGYFLPPILAQYYDLKKFNTHYPHLSVLDSKKKIWKIEFKEKKPSRWVTLSSLPKYVYGALLVSEDWAFFQHSGYDLNQIKDVLNESLEKKRLTRGASTITQQVVKNVYLSHDRTLKRKVLELFLAMELEKYSQKRRILEVYINIAELGPSLFGVEQASQYYFKKGAKFLQPKEAAFLALLLPNPMKNAQSFKNKELTPFAKRGIKNILHKMQQAGFITIDDRTVAMNTALAFEKNFEATLPGSLIFSDQEINEDEFYEREEPHSDEPEDMEADKKAILDSVAESEETESKEQINPTEKNDLLKEAFEEKEIAPPTPEQGSSE